MIELKPSEYAEICKKIPEDQIDELAGKCRDTATFWALLAQEIGRVNVWEIMSAAGRRTRG